MTGKLRRTLESTNPVESMIEIVRDHTTRVKHPESGDMALHWAAAGMLVAEAQFRRVKGFRSCRRSPSRSGGWRDCPRERRPPIA